MVSVKTKSALIEEIVELLGAVGDKFEIEMTGQEDDDAAAAGASAATSSSGSC